MKTSEDITKSIREIGRDVDEICLRYPEGYCQIFDRRYADRLAITLNDLNLKSWEIVDVQRKSIYATISRLYIYLEWNNNHQTNIFGDVVEVLLDSFWK